VVETRVYVRDIGQWEAVGRVHGEVFADIRPATTLVEVSQLITSDLLWKSPPWRSWTAPNTTPS